MLPTGNCSYGNNARPHWNWFSLLRIVELPAVRIIATKVTDFHTGRHDKAAWMAIQFSGTQCLLYTLASDHSVWLAWALIPQGWQIIPILSPALKIKKTPELCFQSGIMGISIRPSQVKEKLASPFSPFPVKTWGGGQSWLSFLDVPSHPQTQCQNKPPPSLPNLGRIRTVKLLFLPGLESSTRLQA